MFKEYWIELDTIDGAKQLNAIHSIGKWDKYIKYLKENL